MEPRDRLKDCFLCRRLDADEVRALAEIAVFQRVEKGQPLFWEGDPAAGFYVLLAGSIRIYKASPEGKEFTIHQIRPGQMFAEAAIFSEGGFPANAAALTDAEVAFFPKNEFRRLLERSPNISLKMIAGLSAFVREFNQKVEDLSLKEVSARLARFLLAERDRLQTDTLVLDSTKAELASKLGTISETLSRNLKKLSALGIIAVDGNRITLLDPSRLENIAGGEKI